MKVNNQSGKYQRCTLNTMACLAVSFFLFVGCSFDYGQTNDSSEEQPEIIMLDVEYVRVENGEPMLQFKAEKAEQYEESRTMKLSNFSFTQFNQDEEKEDTSGFAGSGVIDLDSKDVALKDGVYVDAASEDMQISTEVLHWKDEEKELDSGAEDVFVERPDGTTLSGSGFSADLRTRTWEFSSSISGTYVYEEKEEDTENSEQ
ncbi:MAG: LPS export ABC transporter periplasmic protein LptC [Treponema sp.]|jgi:LPS export ABC transporter protein LptC|nr:LPS export ABC transporter periplasmic protein LptC [Treponema sp.]